MWERIAAFFTAAILGLWGILGSAVYPAFYRSASPAADIPGLREGFVPQGVTAAPDTGEILISAYRSDEGQSQLFAVKENGAVRAMPLERPNGEPYTEHAGGVTTDGKTVFVSSGGSLWHLPLSDVQKAKNGDALRFAGGIAVPCRASFCACDGSRLYVGEYHADGYETDESHRVSCAGGGEYQAMVFAYPLTPELLAGGAAPTAVYAIRDKTQGFAMLPGDRAALSCSGGLKSSELRLYDASGEADGAFTLDGKTLPLFVLDAARALSSLRMPPKSEDLEAVGDSLLIGFESAAGAYGAGFAPFSVGSVMRCTPPAGDSPVC